MSKPFGQVGAPCSRNTRAKYAGSRKVSPIGPLAATSAEKSCSPAVPAERRMKAVAAEAFEFGDLNHRRVLERAPTPALPRKRERERAAVMRGLGPRIHVLTRGHPKTWMAGTSPAMTRREKTGSRVCSATLRAAPRPENEINYPKSSAASLTCSDASASATPSPRSGGCVRGSPRTAGRLLPACGRCSCRCRSACEARALRAA
jgi:hypothetical protein